MPIRFLSMVPDLQHRNPDTIRTIHIIISLHDAITICQTLIVALLRTPSNSVGNAFDKDIQVGIALDETVLVVMEHITIFFAHYPTDDHPHPEDLVAAHHQGVPLGAVVHHAIIRTMRGTQEHRYADAPIPPNVTTVDPFHRTLDIRIDPPVHNIERFVSVLQ
ncbi:hypothetical protein GCK32_007803 [Trichostrongylus colubriformis]|uniref:Uncharacterized protein n=1 Tax=Trichostrongylus colubriformis TaxID=6319 RepID=A0AAN8IJ62_TRICO